MEPRRYSFFPLFKPLSNQQENKQPLVSETGELGNDYPQLVFKELELPTAESVDYILRVVTRVLF
jgi:hypothetical protein